MRTQAPPLSPKGVFKACLVMLYSASTALATPEPWSRDLGELGATYSFRIGTEDAGRRMKHVFMVGNAVENAKLSSISGNGYSDASRQGQLDELAVGFGTGGQLVAYAYRGHATVPTVPAFGPSSIASKAEGDSDQTYSYSREVENNLWWAEPA